VLTWALTLFARPLPLSFLALPLAGRPVLLLPLTFCASFALFALPFGLTALALRGLSLVLTLCGFLALRLLALALTCGLALGSAALLSGTGLLTRHALPRCQHSSS
jgi:hypothetical protein